MSNVVQLDDFRPHSVGPARCLNCRHEWIATTPQGMRSFECPACELSRGVWRGVATPHEGSHVMTCIECEEQMFWILGDGQAMCVNCGTYQAVPRG